MKQAVISTDRLRQVFRHENPEEIIGYLKYHFHKKARKNSWQLGVVRELVKAGYRIRPTHFRGQVWRYQDNDYIITPHGKVRENKGVSTKGWRYAAGWVHSIGYQVWLGQMMDTDGVMRFIYGWRNTDKGVEVYTDMGPMYPDDKDILHYQL
jgi:hypothetical protein